MYKDILRYMGHKGDADTRIINMISSCIIKLAAVIDTRYVIKQVSCVVSNSTVTIDSLVINSRVLASHLLNCDSAFVMTATLGASVDRLIAQRSVIDTLEAFCIQACAASHIENYCDDIEKELMVDAEKKDLQITSRFSPGYADFDIKHQSDILRLLNAQKHTGVTVTNSLMLSPLKSVTAITGLKTACNSISSVVKNKCDECRKDCQFRAEKGIVYD